jgi:GWxTD domain-containing protein
MANRLTSGLLVLLTSHISLLAAQTSGSQSDFERLQDSLAGVTDTVRLRALFRDSDDPVRAGVIGIRLGELGADPDFSEAVGRFRRATRPHSGNAAPWFGLGQAKAKRSEWEMRDMLRLGSRVGLGTLEQASDAYRRALAIDPTYVAAAIALGQVDLSLLDTTRLRTARDLLRRTVASVPEAPRELLLVWGRVERASGSLRLAASAFERFLASGGNPALGLLELGRCRLALGEASGDAPYYEGAALDDAETVAEYRADLQVIAPDSILHEFDSLRGQRRAAFLHRFWTDRDHFDLRPEGERLREHYRRLQFARTHFPLTVSRRFYGPQDAFRSGSVEVDDRGIIYIRQGEPAERIRPFIFGAMPNESWRYNRAEGDLLFHFSSGYDAHGGGDLYDYRLVQSVLDLRGAEDAPRDQLILSRQSLSPIYSHMLNWGRFGSANEAERERHIGATSIAVGTTTDSHELQFRRRLGAVADLIAIGQSARGGLGHFVFGIAAAGTTWQRSSSGIQYPVRVRLVALDRHDRAVATLDTSLVIRHDRPLEEKEFLVARVELPLPPGRWSYRAAIQEGDSGGVLLPRDTVLVAHNGELAPALSDIALGSPGRAVPWKTETGDTVLLAPSALFREKSQVEIYYEVRGARTGAGYRHQIAVLRPGRKAEDQHPLVALSFEELAAGPVIRSRRVVRIDRLTRGSYIVEVRVTGPEGQQQVRRRLIHIIGD